MIGSYPSLFMVRCESFVQARHAKIPQFICSQSYCTYRMYVQYYIAPPMLERERGRLSYGQIMHKNNYCSLFLPAPTNPRHKSPPQPLRLALRHPFVRPKLATFPTLKLSYTPRTLPTCRKLICNDLVHILHDVCKAQGVRNHNPAICPVENQNRKMAERSKLMAHSVLPTILIHGELPTNWLVR